MNQLAMDMGEEAADTCISDQLMWHQLLAMKVLLLWASLLLRLTLAAIQDDNELKNKISDSEELMSDFEDDDEKPVCDAKGGCVQQRNDYVPHSPLIPCDRV